MFTSNATAPSLIAGVWKLAWGSELLVESATLVKTYAASAVDAASNAVAFKKMQTLTAKPYRIGTTAGS